MSNDELSSYRNIANSIVQEICGALLFYGSIGSGSLPTHSNPLVKCGAKVYSQNDEDGITFEILRRIGIKAGIFAEFGVGNGTENNTLALAAAGWGGIWIGGQDLAFNFNPRESSNPKFYYLKEWITRNNIVSLYRDGLAKINKSQCHLASLDLDGNDYYFVDELLSSNFQPEVFIVEYNGKFIPPIRFKIDYDEDFRWKGDDYFGASLTCFNELFEKHGYFLACCNITGANAFFIRNTHKSLFSDIQLGLENQFGPPRYFLTGFDLHRPPLSIKAIENIFFQLNST